MTSEADKTWPANTWLPIPGFERYEISARGEVRSVRFPTRMLAQSGSGRSARWPQVTLCIDGARYTRRIHVLMAAAFHGPRPLGQVVRHLNDEPSDNRPENLAYGTYFDNTQDLIRNGKHFALLKTHCKHGHEFNVSNTIIRPNGNRACRECANKRQRAYMSRKFHPVSAPAAIKGA